MLTVSTTADFSDHEVNLGNHSLPALNALKAKKSPDWNQFEGSESLTDVVISFFNWEMSSLLCVRAHTSVRACVIAGAYVFLNKEKKVSVGEGGRSGPPCV